VEKDTKKLDAEELEKRVAPMALVYTEPTNPDPNSPTTTPTTSTPDQPGNSDGHRQNDFKQQV